jgi:TolB-like protein/DNA-binding winged helix-turn-helix (wHTH) protein/Flp pilus assembly protein TadD
VISIPANSAFKESSGRKWTFSGCEFDELRRELRVQGQPVELEHKPIEVLLQLLQRPGEVFTKEALLDSVWPGLMVVDGSLATAVSKLRRALGDEDSSIIQTVPRVGYRLGVPVQTRAIAIASTPRFAEPGARVTTAANSRSRLTVAVIVLLLCGTGVALSYRAFWSPHARQGAAGGISSVAVLPLANLSGDASQEYLADGMTEELITELSKVQALRVISRTSVMQYKGVPKSLPQIARELKVDCIVEGSFVKSGARIRVTAQLIRASTDTSLWAETYDRGLEDIVILQDELAREISREVKIKLSPAEEKQLSSAAKVNPEAHELYLKGRYFWNLRTRDALYKAADYFQKATAVDANYAQGYAGLADTYAELVGFGNIDPAKGIPAATEAGRKAIELDDSMAEPHAALGYVLAANWRWNESQDEFKKALAINPKYNVALYQYGFLLSMYGHHDEAIRLTREALENDPLSPIVLYRAGRVEFQARHYPEASQLFNRVLELNPNDALGIYGLGLVSEAEAQHEQAISYFQHENLEQGFDLAGAYAAAGRAADARRTLAENLDRLKRDGGYVRPGWIGEVYAALGDSTEAMKWLEKGYEQRDAWLALTRVWPAFDSLRSDSRFQDLVKRMNFPD